MQRSYSSRESEIAYKLAATRDLAKFPTDGGLGFVISVSSQVAFLSRSTLASTIPSFRTSTLVVGLSRSALSHSFSRSSPRLVRSTLSLSPATRTFSTTRIQLSNKMAPVPFQSKANDKGKDHFDLLVIGGGSGGLGAARRAAQYGAKDAIFEETRRLGGTCVNVGCVPKKVMWHAADVREKLHHANAYGFTVPEENTHIDWPTLKNKRDKYIERLNGIYERSQFLPSFAWSSWN